MPQKAKAKPKTEPPIWDRRMIELLQYLKDTGLVPTQRAFFDGVGFNHRSFVHIKNGKQSFTHDHLLKAAEIWNVNMNWFYGLEETRGRVRARIREGKIQAGTLSKSA